MRTNKEEQKDLAEAMKIVNDKMKKASHLSEIEELEKEMTELIRRMLRVLNNSSR